jgi:hypothetical protein
VVSVDGTGMSLSQRFSALNKEKAQRRNVVNHQPVGAGINKRATVSPSTSRSLNQFQGNTRNQPTSPVRGGRRGGVPLLGGSRRNSYEDVRSPRGNARGRGNTRGGVATTRGAARATVATRGTTTRGRGATTRGSTRGGRGGATRGTTRGGRGSARGGKGTRGAKASTSTLTAENLDKELAKYMLKDEKIGAQMLDSELDDYMAQRDAAAKEEKTD